MKDGEVILRELNDLFSALDDCAAAQTAAAVASHARVFVCGAGRSGLMLRAFAMRLAQMGKTVFVAGDTVTPAIGRGDLLLAASASGTTGGVVRNAETARAVGADLLVLTASPDAPLASMATSGTVVLPAATKDCAGASEQVMGSLFEQAVLLFGDAVIARLVSASGDAKQMRARHANLE